MSIIPKPVSSWGKIAKVSSATVADVTVPATYLLKEDGFFLLQENGDKIILIDTHIITGYQHWRKVAKPVTAWGL